MFNRKSRQPVEPEYRPDLSALLSEVQAALRPAAVPNAVIGAAGAAGAAQPASLGSWAPSSEVTSSLLHALPLHIVYLSDESLQRNATQFLPFVPAAIAAVEELVIEPMRARGEASAESEQEMDEARKKLSELGDKINEATDEEEASSNIAEFAEQVRVLAAKAVPSKTTLKKADKTAYHLLAGGAVWLAGRMT